MARATVLGVCLFVLAVCATASRADYRCDADGITDRYDWIFQIAAKRWMPPELADNWCVQKALCVNESGLDPEAMSPAHAIGLCQVLETTAGDFGLRGQLRDVRSNVKASALTFERGWRFWLFKRTTECRIELVLAGYNAGDGNVLKAQILSGGRLCWEGIRPYLADVTGRHALETENYITRFWTTWRRLRGFTLD